MAVPGFPIIVLQKRTYKSFQANEDHHRVAIKSSLILVFVVVFLLTGCQVNEIHSDKVKIIKAGIAGKAEAAQLLQTIIANAYDISIQHRGFKPEAIPPNPPPYWTPQEALKVDESAIRTTYWEQHWREESTVTKVAEDSTSGYATEFTLWRGIQAEKTVHSVEIRFNSVKQIIVERPFLYKCAIVKLYYMEPSGQLSSELKSDEFKIWIRNNQKKQYGTDNCLAVLSVLCPDLDNMRTLRIHK